MAELIWAVISGTLAFACLIISITQFKEKGILFNNASIWASKQERETMDKKPYYRQSGIAFALCAAIFFSMAVECVLLTGWLWIVVGVLAIAVLIYAIASSVKQQTN